MNTDIRQSMNLHDWFMLIGLSILWGGSFFFVGVAITELSPPVIVFLRLLLASVTLWLVVFMLRVPIPDSMQAWIALLVMGLLNNVIPFSLIVWGQSYIESGLASIFNAMTPLFTVLVAGVFLFDERFSGKRILGVLLGLSGAIVMVGADALRGISADVWAQLAVLGAALSYAFATVYGRRFRRLGLNPVAIATGQVSMSTVVMLPIVFLSGDPVSLSLPSLQVVFAMVTLAVFSTALAYILYFRVLSSAGATNVSLVTFLVPISAIALGFLFLDERLGLTHLVGMLLIGIGLSLIDGRLWRRIKAQTL